MIDKPLVLIGMMGSGKSAVGRRLARALGRTFRDSDVEIERTHGQTIAQMVAQHGEPYFRDTEEKHIADLLNTPHLVLATGGGPLLRETTRVRLKQQAYTIWLQADVPTLLTRIRPDGKRPLLAGKDLAQTLHDLLTIREPIYAAAADLNINTNGQSLEAVVGIIVEGLEDFESA